MRLSAVPLLLCLTLSAALAGCGDDGGAPAPPGADTPLPADKGGIAGLVIDDVYRPIAQAQLVLFPIGLTTTADALGQFSFVGLEPGPYQLQVTAKDHEAPPVPVDVAAGEYSEVEAMARRVFSDDGRIVTTQFSVFVPCAVSRVEGTTTTDCTADQSGDTYRVGFVSDYRPYGSNATWLVTEMRANQKASPSQGAYKVVVRQEGDGDYWGSKFTIDSDYLKITIPYGNASTDDTEGRNKPWMNDLTMETLLFPQGAFKSETQGALDAGCGATGLTCFESRGLGAQVGVKATFVQSLFLGPPVQDVPSYAVLAQ